MRRLLTTLLFVSVVAIFSANVAGCISRDPKPAGLRPTPVDGARIRLDGLTLLLGRELLPERGRYQVAASRLAEAWAAHHDRLRDGYPDASRLSDEIHTLLGLEPVTGIDFDSELRRGYLQTVDLLCGNAHLRLRGAAPWTTPPELTPISWSAGSVDGTLALDSVTGTFLWDRRFPTEAERRAEQARLQTFTVLIALLPPQGFTDRWLIEGLAGVVTLEALQRVGDGDAAEALINTLGDGEEDVGVLDWLHPFYAVPTQFPAWLEQEQRRRARAFHEVGEAVNALGWDVVAAWLGRAKESEKSWSGSFCEITLELAALDLRANLDGTPLFDDPQRAHEEAREAEAWGRALLPLLEFIEADARDTYPAPSIELAAELLLLNGRFEEAKETYRRLLAQMQRIDPAASRELETRIQRALRVTVPAPSRP